jgi:hypothetical protein
MAVQPPIKKPDENQNAMAGQALWQLAMTEVGKWLKILKTQPDEMMFDKVSDLVRVLELSMKLLEASQLEEQKDPYRVQTMPPEQYATWVTQALEAWMWYYEHRHPGVLVRKELHAQMVAVIQALVADRPLPEGTMETTEEWTGLPPLKELQAKYGISSPEQYAPWGVE